MPKRPHRQSKNTTTPAELQRLVEAEVSRRLQQAALPQGAYPLNQDALFAQMTTQQAPAKQGTPMFAPGAPLIPSPGLVDPSGPRAYQFPVGYNISSRPRSTESTSFDTLRNLAMLYDGIQLCEQVWLDTVSKLNLVVKPRPEIVAEQGQSASNQKYAEKIRKYTDILSYPDKYNGYDLKTWLRAAVRDQLQIDAVAIYIRKNRIGGVFSLELVDGTLIKPLIDPRGRRPQPPYPAYQQFYYGVPDGWYTSEEMIYLKETPRTESIYGLSRVERIIMRVNQALRKQNKDLTKFTDGNMPPGILEPPAEAGEQWTPEQLAAYQMMFDAMLAGNDQARSRIRVIAPGSTYTPIEETDIYLDFDRFLLNVTVACFSMTMADIGFTENVNKSSGDSQENVFYRRAVQPLMDRYAQLFTQILRDYFDEQDLIVTWGGFEEAEDFNAMATSYVALVSTGIIGPTAAAQQMKLPTSGPEIPPFVLTKDGPVFLEDAADPQMRSAASDAKKAGYELAKNPPPAPGQAPGQPGKPQDDEEKAPQGNEEPQDDEEKAKLSGPPAKKPDLQRSVDNQAHTGMMIAFMLKDDAASQLALPDGEDPAEMHCTLAYLGDMNDLPGDDSLRPDTSPNKIKEALAMLAHAAKPLQGKTSGLARFAVSKNSDGLSPVVALVNVDGLQDFRSCLVAAIEAAGYNAASNFEYTPHITLAYIDPDAPMPVNEVPSVPLVFDEICLAIGDEHSYFKLGQGATEERQDDPDFFALATQRRGDPQAKPKFSWRAS